MMEGDRRPFFSVLTGALGLLVILAILLMQELRPPSRPSGQQAGIAQKLGQVASVTVERPGALQAGVDGAQAQTHLEEEAAADVPDYTEHDLSARAGQVVTLTFRNTSDPRLNYEHSWALVNPGTENRVSIAAERAGSVQGWIPDSPDILAHTGMLRPGESQTIAFRAPRRAGDYPFICLYPMHGTKMRGTLHVSR